jgi:hypothetical protein
MSLTHETLLGQSAIPSYAASRRLERFSELCRELDICTALDPDAKAALYNAKTVSQLVSALAHFIQQQGLKSA